MGLFGQPLTDELEFLGHDLPVDVDVGAPVELDPHDREPDRRARAHAHDPGRAVHRGLDGLRDEDLDLLRRQAAGLGHDATLDGQELVHVRDLLGDVLEPVERDVDRIDLFG